MCVTAFQNVAFMPLLNHLSELQLHFKFELGQISAVERFKKVAVGAARGRVKLFTKGSFSEH